MSHCLAVSQTYQSIWDGSSSSSIESQSEDRGRAPAKWCTRPCQQKHVHTRYWHWIGCQTQNVALKHKRHHNSIKLFRNTPDHWIKHMCPSIFRGNFYPFSGPWCVHSLETQVVEDRQGSKEEHHLDGDANAVDHLGSFRIRWNSAACHPVSWSHLSHDAYVVVPHPQIAEWRTTSSAWRYGAKSLAVGLRLQTSITLQAQRLDGRVDWRQAVFGQNNIACQQRQPLTWSYFIILHHTSSYFTLIVPYCHLRYM